LDGLSSIALLFPRVVGAASTLRDDLAFSKTSLIPVGRDRTGCTVSSPSGTMHARDDEVTAAAGCGRRSGGIALSGVREPCLTGCVAMGGRPELLAKSSSAVGLFCPTSPALIAASFILRFSRHVCSRSLRASGVDLVAKVSNRWFGVAARLLSTDVAGVMSVRGEKRDVDEVANATEASIAKLLRRRPLGMLV
jgi:hypothetical protein